VLLFSLVTKFIGNITLPLSFVASDPDHLFRIRIQALGEFGSNPDPGPKGFSGKIFGKKLMVHNLLLFFFTPEKDVLA
jgi:hypothetical protein